MKPIMTKYENKQLQIMEYPTADLVKALPETHITQQIKSLALHRVDLINAKNSLELIGSKNNEVMNNALAQSAIISYYKCFSSSKGRQRLKENKIFVNCHPDYNKVFLYYLDLRNKFIAHDESRLAQALVGVVLDSKKELPYIDIVYSTMVADKFTHKEDIEHLSWFYRITTHSLDWVQNKIDELVNSLVLEYKEKPLSEFLDFPSFQMQAPTDENMYQK